MNDFKIIDEYYTIAEPAISEIKIKGSVFIAAAYNATDRQQALNIHKEIKAKHHDASHNCYAYRIGFDGADFRAADDGEPSGTAGKPILAMLQKYELSDSIVVVTRYFGGTKLGVGGLVRAYSDSAESVLQIVSRKTIYRTIKFYIQCGYNDVSTVKKLIQKDAVRFEEVYTDKVEFKAEILISKADDFEHVIYEITYGRVSAERISMDL
ncbi:MAG: YigZ family protein [Candidatus Kapabacteria bacterium]|jgi:uncharacterized YigZ family protein|nr:YigZ family protein [Candidatus Kapabacteria bacterium]